VNTFAVKNKTYRQFELLNKELGGNKLVELIMEHIPTDYQYQTNIQSDKEIAAEVRAKKYA